MALKAGKDTTEFQIAKSSGLWAIVTAVLGLVITVGSAVAQGLGHDTGAGIVVGAIVTCAGALQKTLTSLGYIKSRTDVKTTAPPK